MLTETQQIQDMCMHVCTSMTTYIYMYMYIYMRVWVHVYMYVTTQACTTGKFVCVYSLVCVYVCVIIVWECVHAHVSVCLCTLCCPRQVDGYFASNFYYSCADGQHSSLNRLQPSLPTYVRWLQHLHVHVYVLVHVLWAKKYLVGNTNVIVQPSFI